MAKQINRHIKLRGTIDEISFYKSQDGYLARAKGGVSGDRIKTDPNFEITRLNGLEFGAGGKAGKAFRKALKAEIKRAADNRVASRVTQLMVRILKTDPLSEFGYRKVTGGDLSLLTGFEFNLGVPLDQAISTPLVSAIDRVTGQATVNVPALTPKVGIVAPDGTTHYKIFAAATAVDFEAGKAEAVRQETAVLPWDTNPAAAAALNLALPANSPLPLFLAVGIEFLIMVNGKAFPQSKNQSALQLAVVDVPA